MRSLSWAAVAAVVIGSAAAGSFARAQTQSKDAPDYAVDVNANLYEVDCEQLAWRKVGPIRVPLADGMSEVPKLYDIAASPDGFLYGISSDVLYMIRLEKPEESVRIGRHGISNPYGMQAGPKGELLVNNLEGDVWVVDRKTAKATKLGPMGGDYVASGDIACITTITVHGKPPETFVVSSVKDERGREHLVRLDAKTGEATSIGPCIDQNGQHVENVFGLVCRRDTLYGLTTGGDFLKIDPFTGKCTRLKNAGIVWWGATDYQRF